MSRKLTTAEFACKARIVHGDMYCYDKVVYTNSKNPVEIECRNHGNFLQTPNHHLKGCGCPKCANNVILTTKEFIAKAQMIHKNLYGYSETEYIRSALKAAIICKEHGKFFQRPNDHLNGMGCPKCGDECIGNLCRFTTDIFVSKSMEVHGTEYDYSNVSYTGIYDKVTIVCKNHGKFFQSPTKHLMGHGCPRCQHQISKLEIDFLDYLRIKERQKYIRPYKVDGYDPETNTIYEYMGDYWHGNPMRFNSADYNKICHKTYGELYDESLRKIKYLIGIGYNVKYVWEQDWKNFRDGVDAFPNIRG